MKIGENQPQPAALEETGLLDFLGVVTGKQCFKVYLNTAEIDKS